LLQSPLTQNAFYGVGAAKRATAIKRLSAQPAIKVGVANPSHDFAIALIDASQSLTLKLVGDKIPTEPPLPQAHQPAIGLEPMLALQPVSGFRTPVFISKETPPL